MKPEILALIPARGGSKGIPGKNLIPIAGLPLIAHTIAQGQQSRLITRVIVSTDDDDIATTAREYGADAPFMRPSEFAQDLSPDVEAFDHALRWLAEHEGYQPDLVVHLRATGPVRRIALIDEAIQLLLDHPEADCVRSVSAPEQTPYKMWRMENGCLQPIATVPGVKEPWSQPRQTLPPVFWQNGYVDVMRPETILEMGMMCGGTILPFIVDEPKLELDYPEDIPAIEEALAKMARGEALTHAKEGDRHPV